jgi:hypothetical protein
MIRPILVAAALVFGSLPTFAAEKSSQDNAELRKLFDEDQVDRMPPSGKLLVSVDWEAVSMRDEVRERRVKELIGAGALGSGADYYHAAMILQHAPEPDDYLLAHDLCVVAIGKGEDRAKWLAAASLDRFLTSIGRSQRFGTQYSSRRSSQPPRLNPVDPGMPDSLRRAFNVPTLEEARQREAQMAREFEQARQTRTKP